MAEWRVAYIMQKAAVIYNLQRRLFMLIVYIYVSKDHRSNGLTYVGNFDRMSQSVTEGIRTGKRIYLRFALEASECSRIDYLVAVAMGKTWEVIRIRCKNVIVSRSKSLTAANFVPTKPVHWISSPSENMYQGSFGSS